MIAPAGHRILITDDDQRHLDTLRNLLREEGYRVSTASSGEDALGVLRKEQIHLLVTDLVMPSMSGIELIGKVLEEWPHMPVVVLSGVDDNIDCAVDAMRAGAVDYLTKPYQPTEVKARLRKRLEERALRTEIVRLSAEVRRSGRYGEIIGANARMREIFEVIERVGARPAPVLIQGDPGTGKERIARAIHHRFVESKLPSGADESDDPMLKMVEIKSPYIAVNCGAFATTLLESQLFGHKKGAFTGAIQDQEGVFVAARSGTLFLDEITELDVDLQVRLLRAIQEREVTPLGSTQSIPINARIITATNRDLSKCVEEGKFRADLYWRINVVNIEVPPLKERVDDIPLLVDYFMERIAESYGVSRREITKPVMEAFQSYDWPGNVRELQNVIERAFALGKDDRRITLEDLTPELLGSCRGRRTDEGDETRVFPTYDTVVREHLIRALQASRGVKSRAASMLEIDRNRLYRLMDKYEIVMDR